MAVYWILALCTRIWVTRGVGSCVSGTYKCNPDDGATYHQCDNGVWTTRDCGSNLQWSDTHTTCVDPNSYDTTCTTDSTSSSPSSSSLSSSSGFSTVTPTATTDTSTQCPTINTGTVCPCLSPNLKYVNLTQEVLEEILENLKKELTLNKTLLAKSLRRRISAKDNRLSSKLMGYTGAIMLATPIVIIVLSDAANLIRSLSVQKRRRRISSIYPA